MQQLQFGMPGLYFKVYEDFVAEYPEHAMRIVRVLTDLSKRIKHRGVDRTLCIDFPKLGKAYDKGLSSGIYSVNTNVNIYQGEFSHRRDLGITPLLELSYRYVNGRWHLRSNLDPRVVFFTRTFLYGCKKLSLRAPDNVREECERDFFHLDASIKPLELDERTKSLVSYVSRYFIPLKYPEWDELDGRHGPGAVSDCKRKHDKFCFRAWSENLEEFFPHSEFSVPNQKFEPEFPHKKCESFGKIRSVPKTLDKTRVITVEPSSNQFFQQALRNWILKHMTALAKRSIDISSQELSKIAAKQASKDGCNATIDLKSASDYLSSDLVKVVFSNNKILCDLLFAVRTETVIDLDGKQHTLKKYAGQGNATTFIVQSLVYTILATCAIVFDTGLHPKTAAKKVRVFGDDIIMPSANMLTFSRITNEVGLSINTDKTHHQGFFREACGGDFFHGNDVTPFYIKSFTQEKGPEGLVSWCAVSNNAYIKGLWRTAYYMRENHNLPVNSPSGIGFYSNLPFRYTPLRSRWNGDLQRREYYELVSKTRSKELEPQLSYGRLYKYFVEKPNQQINWNGSLTVTDSLVLTREWVA